MSALQFQSSALLSTSSCTSRSLSCSSNRIKATIHVPKHKLSSLSLPQLPNTNSAQECDTTNTIPTKTKNPNSIPNHLDHDTDLEIVIAKLYVILEAVSDRVEMHINIGQQRDNWNSLLLNSVNMITLTATTMVALGAPHGTATPLNVSSSLLFFAATGMLIVMNKMQPSQLVEEQRNATRLFKQLKGEIETLLALHVPNQDDVDIMMERVLALDRAYPLPLLGGLMLEKFPKKYKPAIWWPKKNNKFLKGGGIDYEMERNGWNEGMEIKMREIVEVVKIKDKEEYERLGNIALKVNKVLAISGPVLTWVAATGSGFAGFSSLAAVVAAVAGAAATVINSLEHGGQVGMVFEMYRNCGGCFKHTEELIEYTLEEREMERRENGELFEMKMALKLGRSLSELRDLAVASASSRRDGNAIGEYASKLF